MKRTNNSIRMLDIRSRHETFMANWEKAGKPVKEWECPHCHKNVKAIAPKRSEVTKQKPYWDSLKICVNCGGYSYVRVYVTKAPAVQIFND